MFSENGKHSNIIDHYEMGLNKKYEPYVARKQWCNGTPPSVNWYCSSFHNQNKNDANMRFPMLTVKCIFLTS